jgi:hypothetical protein
LDRLRVLGIAQSTLPALGYMQAGSGTCYVLLTASAEKTIPTRTWDVVKMSRSRKSFKMDAIRTLRRSTDSVGEFWWGDAEMQDGGFDAKGFHRA